MIRTLIAITMAAFALFSTSTSTLADTDVASSIVQVNGSPVALTRCLMREGYGSYYSALNVYNRSIHGLIDYSIAYKVYDRDQTLIGQATFTYTPGVPLEPNDSGVYPNNQTFIQLSESSTATALITCKVVKADFTGRIQWSLGMPWTGGPLSSPPNAPTSMAPAERDTVVPGGGGGEVSMRAPSSVKFSVTNAWNDPASDGVFVHDTVVLHGGATPATIRASEFALAVTLATGVHTSVTALSQAAPSYQKFNPATNATQYVPQIDPSTDLGLLGSVIVPANGDVTVTVTFPVTGHLANPGDNRAVSLR